MESSHQTPKGTRLWQHEKAAEAQAAWQANRAASGEVIPFDDDALEIRRKLAEKFAKKKAK